MGASGASGLGAGATGSDRLISSTWNLSGVFGGTLGGAPLTPYPSSGTMFSVRFIPALRAAAAQHQHQAGCDGLFGVISVSSKLLADKHTQPAQGWG